MAARKAAKKSAAKALLPADIPKTWGKNGGKLPTAIAVVGAESALRSEALKNIRAAAFEDGDGGMNWVVIHTDEGDGEGIVPATVLDEACTLPMFGGDEPKVVVVRRAEVLLATADQRDIFERNIEKLPEGAILVFEIVETGKLKTTRIYKQIAALGGVVSCEPLRSQWGLDGPDSNLTHVMIERGRAAGLAMSPGAAMALIARCGQDLGVLEEELGKLALSLGAEADKQVKVTEREIDEICAHTRLVGAFEFADATADRNTKSALEALGAIFAHGLGDYKKPGRVVTNEGSIAMRLLGALTYKLTQMQDLQALIDAGIREDQAYAQLKYFGPRRFGMQKSMRKHTGKSLRIAMHALFRVNMDLRTGVDRRTALEKMVLDICRG